MNTLLSAPVTTTHRDDLIPTSVRELSPTDRLALHLGRWLIARAERPRPVRDVSSLTEVEREAARRHYDTLTAHAQAFASRWN